MIKWLKSLHEAIYKEEQPVAIIFDPITPGQKAMQAMHQANNIYQQAIGQQYQQYLTTGSPGTSAINNWPISNGIGISGPIPQGIFCVPPRTGGVFQMIFVDAMGNHHTIAVDQAHMSILQQISLTQPNTIYVMPAYTPSTAPQKMLEGDFSFDEMEEAEKLIAELAGDKATKGHKASQNTEYASEGI